MFSDEARQTIIDKLILPTLQAEAGDLIRGKLVMMTPEAKATRVLGPKAARQSRDEWIHNRGLDRPLPAQFVHYVKNLATFDFGTTYVPGRNVRDVFLQGVGPSLLITVPGFFAALLASLGLALFQVFVRDSPLDRTLTVASVALMSVPTMVYVIFTQAILALALNYFPAFGFESNRGYPAPVHKAALAAWGPTTIHRRSWIFMEGLCWGGLPPAPGRLF